jgi:hypothetical protein
MRGLLHRTHRFPDELDRDLPFDPRERPLGWASCTGGCRLVATLHGLWESPSGGSPVRHCWRSIEEIRCVGSTMTVRSAPAVDPLCAHVFSEDSALPDLVHALDTSSRVVDLAFRLPSGATLQVRARTCRYEGSLVWTSRRRQPTEAGAVGEPLGTAAREADARETDALLQYAKQEFGTMGEERRNGALPDLSA